MSKQPSLAIVYEHPEWFKPLFAALDRRGVGYQAFPFENHQFDLADRHAPAPVVFSRLAMSSFLRQDEHPIFYAQALYAHWELNGAHVINGSKALAIDANKARQLSVIQSLGLDIPATRVVHRQADIVAATEGLRFPVIVKVNIGGSGAGVSRYDSVDELKQAVANDRAPKGIDSVLLVQEYVPAKDKHMVRMETLDGKFLYAISLNTDGGTFDLCPADVCLIDKPTVTVQEFKPDAQAIKAAEAIARASGLDIGGIEFMIDERDGARRFYDINGLSNFVADPLHVLGWDPHEKLVDYLIDVIASKQEKAT
ncbi:carbamoylphosphate synthase large subunit [Rhodanobacter sp. K2T2]|uniref:ATP-grasp domain-containing protein n=1 Tax=Rhodanobacter sp. K2T2 TaxID=2723085 RepID=UPI0015C78F04|nr:alpha-L-glutamate ligase [Rhodanobacter sp. K2T2]NYE29554.1 carbamoylphosphate synthase large subunit [Rhodanobacter sp. K2T2]